jgi:transposase
MPANVDKSSVKKVCVDDFAFRKRYSYGTIMVDLETHRIIDLIDSRETHKVEEWLKSFPNLEVISRDGAQTYASAARNSHPNALQITDRFHLIKNLSEAIELYIRKNYPSRLEISYSDKSKQEEMEILYNTSNRRERILFAKKKYSEGFSVNDISLLLHSTVKTVKNYVEMEEADIPLPVLPVRERQHLEDIERKKKSIDEVRALKADGCSILEISRRTGHTPHTIRKYLDEGCPTSNAGYDLKTLGKLHAYEKEVIELRAKGVTYSKIHETITAKGYNGTVASLRVFMQKERGHMKNSANGKQLNDYISRKVVCQLVYKNLEEIKGITQEQYEEMIKKYPVLGNLYHAVKEYHRIIFTHKSDELDDWIKTALSLNIEEITTYVNGIQSDLEAVKNCIVHPFNNGLAEGSVNKLKLIKRTMYGRNSFEMLKAKVLFYGFVK